MRKLDFAGTGAVSSVAWSTGAQLMIFFASYFQCCLAVQGSTSFRNTLYLLSPRFGFSIVLNCHLFVNRYDSLTSYGGYHSNRTTN